LPAPEVRKEGAPHQSTQEKKKEKKGLESQQEENGTMSLRSKMEKGRSFYAAEKNTASAQYPVRNKRPVFGKKKGKERRFLKALGRGGKKRGENGF